MTTIENTAELIPNKLGTDEHGCDLYTHESAAALDAQGIKYWADAEGLHCGERELSCMEALSAAQAELDAANSAEDELSQAGDAETILTAAGYDISGSSDSDSVTLAVSSESEGIIDELRALLGPDYSVEYTGDGNTDADGYSTDDVSIALTDDVFSARIDAARERIHAAEAAVGSAREALADSDEEREWQLYEDGVGYATCMASSAADALSEAGSNVDRANYGDAKGTMWIDVRVYCELTGEEREGTVQLEEDEPECEDGSEHDWQSPHEIVGGCESNPGVWANGGGVVIHKVCMRCGCGRTTDTWAQRRDTGEQGLRSVSYEPGEYADQIPTRAERDLADEISCPQLRAGAAYVLSELREESAEPRNGWTRRVRERATEIVGHLSDVYRAAPLGSQPRAQRLALRLATASDADERMAAEAIIAALGW